MTTETVFIIGATGNIGTSAVQGALNAGYNVLATVRNASSAAKLFKNLSQTDDSDVNKQRITTVEVDCVSENGVKDVVKKVEKGELPAFQHVYACVGGPYSPTPLLQVDTKTLHEHMTINFESNFFAYRATIPYLLTQSHATSTWSICTGSQGSLGIFAAPAMSQGALFSLCVSAARELQDTNVRFNEIYLALRVETDRSAVEHGVVRASEFANVYVEVLRAGERVRGKRVLVETREDIKGLRWVDKVGDA
ncbi:NAD(P)-binding protein [Periconia macrospinosa]|uniref:NAD(P)-binding protein n=1 Tax=Periconia macrospinosa TaxID=97972 RepID=A0A2V1E8M5_9PLEO|nr:NAD(P)-binding protein [Periconia macrospinosa]